ncbi:MAG TPA: glycosyltransferase family 39 protein [Anaerolineae bacterium]|nr:glycosyltransferase family 39 protein [Anaerolineae bacterium]HQI87515.1 glycosyltransferase family 39 protein [Anaerolineae bacterium]
MQEARSKRWFIGNWPAIAILITYLVVGTLYAVYTPAWQAPDEPAHYNYIRALAEGRGFPVMEPGDYDQGYLSRLTAEGFPPELSVATLEYEDHQPPLYYLLATPIYWLGGGSVVALRLFSLLLGGVGVAMVMAILREFWPERPRLAWLGSGIVAFIPQFIAMMAAINNDALTLALLWLWLWLALRYLRGQTASWLLGGVLGLLLLTKSTGYGAIVLAVLAIALRARRTGQSLRWSAREVLLILGPALVLGALWWIRNVAVYDWPDVMGLLRHDSVVVGQPRTADWIARDGLFPFLRGAFRTTFRSFWGQFGWMGVVLDARIYLGLAIFSVIGVWGAAWRLATGLRAGLEARQRDGLLLLGASAFITLGLFAGYNLTFVQHQGRYLFPALPLVGLAIAGGLKHLLDRKLAVGTALLMLLALIVAGVVGWIAGDLPLWSMALFAAAMIALPVAAFVPQRWRGLLGGGLLAAFAALDVWCLFGFIVPILTR